MSIGIGSKVIVRAKNAGAFAGVLDSECAERICLRDARRLWYWEGAATLSELATRGPSAPMQCKFPAPVSIIFLLEVIEIIAVADVAWAKIAEVPVWSV